MDIPIVVYDFSWLPGPYDHRGPAKPEEVGKEKTWEEANGKVGVGARPASP